MKNNISIPAAHETGLILTLGKTSRPAFEKLSTYIGCDGYTVTKEYLKSLTSKLHILNEQELSENLLNEILIYGCDNYVVQSIIGENLINVISSNYIYTQGLWTSRAQTIWTCDNKSSSDPEFQRHIDPIDNSFPDVNPGIPQSAEQIPILLDEDNQETYFKLLEIFDGLQDQHPLHSGLHNLVKIHQSIPGPSSSFSNITKGLISKFKF